MPQADKTALKAPAGGDSGNTRNLLPPPRRAIQVTRAERYELLSAARALFIWKGKQEGLEHSQNWHRTAKCKWVTHGSSVGVHASCEHGSAFYSGLINCGSVWSCPVCAVKVQERRRGEIADAIEWAYRENLQPVMVTLTFPHYAWSDLRQLIEQQADALQKLRAGAPWKRFKERHGYRGLIRALELTFGKNGWHPHTHELWFVSSEVDAEEMRKQILERWKLCCARAGLLDLNDPAQVAAFEAHAVDVKGWCSASDYLAKQDDSRHWGADREMAKASSKAGKAKGMHPFGVLAEAAAGDKAAGRLFIEYSEVMKGRRQLFWSKGLKALVGLVDMTDEELADAEQDAADLLGLLDYMDWKKVREAGKRAQLLDAAETGGWAAVTALIREIRGFPAERLSDAASGSERPVLEASGELVSQDRSLAAEKPRVSCSGHQQRRENRAVLPSQMQLIPLVRLAPRELLKAPSQAG